MSVTAATNRGLKTKYTSTSNPLPTWTRPVDWLALPAIDAADQKFVGLHAIYEESNFLALSAAGNYTVDWGDGSSPENFATGVTAEHTYNFTDVVFDGTLTSRGYKQAIVTVTPQSGQNLTTLNLHKKHTQTNLNAYTSGFIDIAVAGTLMTSLLIGVTAAGAAAQVINFKDLEQVNILSSAITTTSYLFSVCSSLASVSVNTPSATVFTFMFNTCSALQTVALLNTVAGITFTSMFEGCASLQTIPLINTAVGVTFDRMFFGCSSLQTIPLINLATGTSFTSMLRSCPSLKTVPALNMPLGITFTSMFEDSISLQAVSLMNVAAGTAFGSMFRGCLSLQTIPQLNTASGTTFSQMFQNCASLQTIPLINTAAGTTFSNMFGGCTSLSAVPLLNVAAASTLDMFATCPSLQNATTSGGRRATSYASAKLSQAGLEAVFAGLGTSNTQGLVITVSTNWGAVTPVALSGTTTAGSTVVTMASTTGITTGMQVTGVGTPSTTAIAVTTTDVGDTVNLVAHGLSDNDEVSFATIVTTTGIVINTIYFVVNAAVDTFQVSATLGGSALALTTNGSGTLRYKATVASIVAGVSVTLSRPATSSGTNTLSYRNLKTNTALLKGYAVTG